MYLSRVEIDPYNRKNARFLAHLGCYHAWVEDSFPAERERAKCERTRKLWRVDNVNNRLYLLVLSKSKPDIEQLEKYGIANSARIKDYNIFLDTLQEGIRAKFRIKLNTVKSYSNREKYEKRGRVVPVPLDELNSYFLDRTEINGFTVKENEFRIVSREEEAFKRFDEIKAKSANLSLVSTTYEGVLTISNLEKFKQTLINGIGKKKAYGFGLMTIIPEK